MKDDVIYTIYTALAGDSRLRERNITVYIDPVVPPGSGFPRITMFEVLREGDSQTCADDWTRLDDVIVRVDYWSKNNDLFVVSKQIRQVIKKQFELCRVTISEDLYEHDTGIFHKPINIQIKIKQEETT